MRNLAYVILGALLALGGLAIYRWTGAESHFPGSVARHQQGAPEQHDSSNGYWTCPMHPSVRADRPGSCPICGMDLTPVHRDEKPEFDPAQPHTDPSHPETPSAEFVIDSYRRQLINVQSAPVEERLLEKDIRAVGILELDETLVSEISPRVSGWIREVHVNFLHQHVHAGEPLFSIYSPELVASQEEYLLALRSVEELGASPFEHVSKGARSLLNAARRRLELFDLSPDQIRRLEREGTVDSYIIIRSPVEGHVIERNAFPNRYVTPESKVYTIADHSRIWAWVQIYEHDIEQVRVGQQAIMRLPAYPNRVFRGQVAFIKPHMDGATRTLRARLEFPNPDLVLKPEMYVDVELKVSLGIRLAVPDSAVLRTGLRDLVFVDRGEGRMELRPVQVGEKAAGFYHVLSGLQIGEQVVIHANFLIDSESKIRGIESDWETPKPRTPHVH